MSTTDSNPQKVSWVDWTMLALAVVSITLLMVEMLVALSPRQTQIIIWTDITICAIFFVEFVWRWSEDDNPKTFAFRNWYEVLGMIPVSHPALRAFRLFRIIRILVLVSRVSRATDRVYGEGFTGNLINQAKAVLVESVADLITIQILERVSAVLNQGTFTSNIARVLEERSEDMTEMVIDNLGNDESLGLIRHAPFFDSTVRISSRVTQRVMIDILKDERTDQLVADMLRENIDQIREAVRKNEALAEAKRNPGKQNPQR